MKVRRLDALGMYLGYKKELLEGENGVYWVQKAAPWRALFGRDLTWSSVPKSAVFHHHDGESRKFASSHVLATSGL